MLISEKLTYYNFMQTTKKDNLLAEPVELVVSSVSICAVRQARHSQNAWVRHVERVESCRVETRRAKWNLGYKLAYFGEL